MRRRVDPFPLPRWTQEPPAPTKIVYAINLRRWHRHAYSQHGAQYLPKRGKKKP